MEKKENFASRIGFIMAAAGSAVGLGNIWRFPYLAAKYGGGIFLIIYILLALTFGFALMTAEIAIGRKTRKSVIGAYKSIDNRFSFLGPIATIVPFIVTPYYCVIGGWVVKYFVIFCSGFGNKEAVKEGFFEEFIGSTSQSTLFFLVFGILTAVVVLFGVQKGIEKISKILMPLLIVLTVGVAVYTMTLPGAFEGLKFYFVPSVQSLSFEGFMKTLIGAMGQLFYSMSLSMGIMITYGSYMRKEDSIEGAVRQIGFFDTLIAVLAGLIIVPAVFVFSGGDAAAMNKGPGLMFVTLPKVFNNMFGGQVVGCIFFFLVSLAALTSSISLFETMVSIIMEKFKVNRVWSTVICIVFLLAAGMTSVLGYGVWSDFTIFGMQILDFYDFISNNIIMPIVALITCILIGYFAKTKFIEDEVESNGQKFLKKKIFRVMILVICPIFMVAILITPFIFDL